MYESVEEFLQTRYYPVNDAAEYVGVDKTEFRKLCKKYGMPYMQMVKGGHKRYRNIDLDKLKEFIKNQ